MKLPPTPARRRMLLVFVACLLLAEELGGFSQGRRMAEDEEAGHSQASSEEQLYELPLPRTRGRPLVSAPSPAAYEASDRPVPQGSNPLHNR
uniref:Uncharacterized protein n=1 Tax=Oryza brachyantha TaxID=4533 RepID=J3N3V3_ORYBR